MKNSAKTRVYGEDLAVHLRSYQAGVDDDDVDVDYDNIDEVNANDVDIHDDEVDDDNDLYIIGAVCLWVCLSQK